MMRIPLSTVKRHHAALLQVGYIRQVESRYTKAYHYEVLSYEEYQQLQQRIITVLDEVTEGLNSSAPAHQISEPDKRKKKK